MAALAALAPGSTGRRHDRGEKLSGLWRKHARGPGLRRLDGRSVARSSLRPECRSSGSAEAASRSPIVVLQSSSCTRPAIGFASAPSSRRGSRSRRLLHLDSAARLRQTNARPNQAWRIRALGPRFHAMAEIHWAAWQGWSRRPGERVRRWRRGAATMAAAGYDVANGDTWAVNESRPRCAGSSKRRGRCPCVRPRPLRRGWAPRKGCRVRDQRPARDLRRVAVQVDAQSLVRGDAFLARHGPGSPILGTGGLRRRAPLGSHGRARATRRDELKEDSSTPRAWASCPDALRRRPGDPGPYPYADRERRWQWPTGLGWTMVSGDQMRHFVSSQNSPFRSYAATQAGPDRFGFAWRRTTRRPCRRRLRGRDESGARTTRRCPSRLGSGPARPGSRSRCTRARLVPGRRRGRGVHRRLADLLRVGDADLLGACRPCPCAPGTRTGGLPSPGRLAMPQQTLQTEAGHTGAARRRAPRVGGRARLGLRGDALPQRSGSTREEFVANHVRRMAVVHKVDGLRFWVGLVDDELIGWSNLQPAHGPDSPTATGQPGRPG